MILRGNPRIVICVHLLRMLFMQAPMRCLTASKSALFLFHGFFLSDVYKNEYDISQQPRSERGAGYGERVTPKFTHMYLLTFSVNGDILCVGKRIGA